VRARNTGRNKKTTVQVEDAIRLMGYEWLLKKREYELPALAPVRVDVDVKRQQTLAWCQRERLRGLKE
jgi:hypothetical protein